MTTEVAPTKAADVCNAQSPTLSPTDRPLLTPLSVGEELLKAAEKVAKLAEPSLSNFYVGAVALGTSGKVYGGVNIELPNQPLQQTVHAEHFCVSAAIASGREESFAAIAVTAAPCGHCRQMLAELPGSGNLQIFLRDPNGSVCSFWLLDDLLPHAITSELLGPKPKIDFATIDVECGKLTVSSGSDASLGLPELTLLRPYVRAEAPYSEAKAGCLLISNDDSVRDGCSYESVAYNPGVPPFQGALIELHFSTLGLGQPSLEELVKHLETEQTPGQLFPQLKENTKAVVLVQGESPNIDHEDTVTSFCKALTSNVQLTSVRVTKSVK